MEDDGHLPNLFPRNSQIPYQMHSSQATTFSNALKALADELKAFWKDFGTNPSGAGQDLSKTTYKCF